MSRFCLRVPMAVLICLMVMLFFTGAIQPRLSTHASGFASITLSVTSGPPSTAVLVHGVGFGYKENIIITFDHAPVTTGISGGAGAFHIGMTVPTSALPGKHTIAALGQVSGRTAHTTFLVQTDWAMYGFGPYGTHFNRFENVLNSTNVSSLAPDWNFNTGGFGFGLGMDTSPAVSDGVVYIGSTDHHLYALDESSGTLLWAFVINGYIESTPAVANGIVYVDSTDGTLYALNAGSGELLWSYTRGNFIASSPVVANGVVYFGSGDGRLYALNAYTGAFLWRHPTKGPISSSPVVVNGIVYVDSWDSHLYAINASTGKTLWLYTSSAVIYTSPAYAKGMIYFGNTGMGNTGLSMLYALNALSGALVWSYNAGRGGEATTPAIANGVVYFGINLDNYPPYTGMLDAFNSTTGTLLWSYTYQGIAGTPAVANGVIYINNNQSTPPQNFVGEFYAINVSTGTLLWNFSTTNSFGDPIIVNGRVYVAVGSNNTSGTLYTFHLPKTAS